MINPQVIRLVPPPEEKDETPRRIVKPGHREKELLAANGQNFITQGRIDSLPDNFQRPYRNIGLISHWLGEADRWSKLMGMQPPEGVEDKARRYEK